MDPNQPVTENYSNPKTCFFHVLFKAAALAFYILSALFIDNFVIIFVVTVLLAALDFWVVKNVSGRILVGLRWWNEINDLGESVWKFECLDQESLARMNKKDSWLFWWTLYLTAVAWIVLAIFSLIRLQADYLLVVGVCLTLSIANIVGFTKCKKVLSKIRHGAAMAVWPCGFLIFRHGNPMAKRLWRSGCGGRHKAWRHGGDGRPWRLSGPKDAKKQFQQFASQTIASRFSSTLQSAFTGV